MSARVALAVLLTLVPCRLVAADLGLLTVLERIGPNPIRDETCARGDGQQVSYSRVTVFETRFPFLLRATLHPARAYALGLAGYEPEAGFSEAIAGLQVSRTQSISRETRSEEGPAVPERRANLARV